MNNTLSFSKIELQLINLYYFVISLFSDKSHEQYKIVLDKAEKERCIEHIFDTYANRIIRFAYSYVHNMDDAEDILQDVLIKCYNKMPQFENSKHEKAWLMKVTANISKNKIKYNNIHDVDELNDELVAQSQEDLAFIWDSVKRLPDKYREVIHLYYYEEYSTKEIAELLNEKESTVRSKLKRGREQLKEILKEEYDFD